MATFTTDPRLVVNTQARVENQTAPSMTQSVSAQYVNGQTLSQTVVLRAGQQYKPNVGFSNLVIQTTGPIQLLASKGSNPSYINMTISQQTTIDDSVDTFSLTNNGQASVTVKFMISKVVVAPTPSTGVVTSLDSMIGDINLVAGDGIKIDDGSQKITISNTGVFTVNNQSGNVQIDADTLPGLSTVAKTGEYSDLLNAPLPYVLPVASSTVLGGVKVGQNLSIDENGVLSAPDIPRGMVTSVNTMDGDVVIRAVDNHSEGSVSLIMDDGSKDGNLTFYRLAVDGDNLSMEVASGVIMLRSNTVDSIKTVNGQAPDASGNVVVKATDNGAGNSLISDSGATTGSISLKKLIAGNNIAITQDASGNLNIAGTTGPYVLPIATNTVLGGVKQGNNVTIAADGTISVDNPYVLPPATTSALGGVIVGDNLTVDANGRISAGDPYTLPVATATVLGGVKIGSNVNVSADGTISVAAPYVLPIATTTVLGGVKQGSNITIAADGTISAASYTLPVATDTMLGGVKIGDNITVQSDGTISVAAPYSLPTASATVLGGIKVGENLSIDGSGVLSAAAAPYTLPTASSTVLGGIKVGDNLSIDGNGVLSGTAPYTLPTASSTVLGGIKVGSGLSIDGSGVLSAGAYALPVATATVLGGVKIGANVNVAGDGTISVAAPYSLPIASSSVLGGVKVGSGLAIDGSGTLSLNYSSPVTSVNTKTGDVTVQAQDNNTATGVSIISDSGATTGNIKLLRLVAGTNVTLTTDASGNLQINAPSSYTLPIASSTTLGGVKIGANVSVAGDGTISVAAPYTLPAATTTTLGGVKVGSGLTVDGTGLLSLNYTSPVTSVSGQTGAVVVKAQDNNTSSGVSIISDSGSTTGTIKLLRLVAGNNVTLGSDVNGNVQINSASAPVTSVNAQTGAVTVSATDAAAGNSSLVYDSGATTGTMKFKKLKAGTNVSITDDSSGTLTVNATFSNSVTSVSGQTGAVVVSTVDNNAATGTSLIADTGATTGKAKLKTLVAGTGVTLSPDANGNISIDTSFDDPFYQSASTSLDLGGAVTNGSTYVSAGATEPITWTITTPSVWLKKGYRAYFVNQSTASLTVAATGAQFQTDPTTGPVANMSVPSGKTLMVVWSGSIYYSTIF